jgi:transcriptional regulator with XRE-family HTH domain
MDTLYSFIVALCKKRGMKIEKLQTYLGCSRSTLYRYMKGINQITPDVEKCFATALEMEGEEAKKFSRFISLSPSDMTLIDSRNALDGFLFGTDAKHPDAKLDLVYFSGDKYLRTLSEITDTILAHGANGGLTGDVRILGCLGDRVSGYATWFLNRVFDSGLDLRVEHYAELSVTDYRRDVSSFVSVFPFLRNESYKLYLSERQDETTIIDNSILIALNIDTGGVKSNRCLMLTFFEDSMSQSIAFDDAYLHEFISRGFDELKTRYTGEVTQCADAAFDVSLTGGAKSSYVIKSSPRSDRLPIETYKSVAARLDGESLVKTLSYLSGVTDKNASADIAAFTQKSLKLIEKRIDAAKSCRRIDIFSKSGLREFARTGVTAGDAFPALTADERRQVLEYIKKQNASAKEDYSAYITREDFFADDFNVTVAKDFGLTVGYLTDGGARRTYAVPSKRLSEAFSDYVETHVPVTRALTTDETDAFLAELIGTL